MSSKAQAVIREFNSLPSVEQLAVYEAITRKVTDCDFIPGQQAAELFKGHRADAEAANAIAGELRKLDVESENALDH